MGVCTLQPRQLIVLIRRDRDTIEGVEIAQRDLSACIMAEMKQAQWLRIRERQMISPLKKGGSLQIYLQSNFNRLLDISSNAGKLPDNRS